MRRFALGNQRTSVRDLPGYTGETPFSGFGGKDCKVASLSGHHQQDGLTADPQCLEKPAVTVPGRLWDAVGRLCAMSEFWLCFNCCIAEQAQPKRRRRIDRSMIGEPTNFVHTAHVGSGDLFSGMNSVNSIQNQMQSKGGELAIPSNVCLLIAPPDCLPSP
ncbi:hypothetical protein COCON_G00172450 [Conger conger]|uniref:CRIB domain-containing protein n=1 Tax=Conger conger TaxID=82655 RepID=A0A9Q1D840_CONCO|nr:hypothetical protein COCON_G00172450 [Conger conger]